MRPAGTFDAARGIFWILCKVAPKTYFFFSPRHFHMTLTKPLLIVWYPNGIYYTIELKMAQFSKRNSKSWNQQISLCITENIMFSDAITDLKITIFTLYSFTSICLLNFLLHEHLWLIERRLIIIYIHCYTANWFKFALNTSDLNEYTFHIQD